MLCGLRDRIRIGDADAVEAERAGFAPQRLTQSCIVNGCAIDHRNPQ